MITFRITDKTGDSIQRFKETDPASLKEAQAVLAKLQASGHIAYKTDKEGKHEVVHKITPGEQQITVVRGLSAG